MKRNTSSFCLAVTEDMSIIPPVSETKKKLKKRIRDSRWSLLNAIVDAVEADRQKWKGKN